MNQGTASGASTTGFVIKLTVVAALGGFLFGYDTAVISGVVPLLTTKFVLDDKLVGIAVSCAIIGCIIGSISAGPISDRVGRKKVLIFTAVLFAISSIGAAIIDSLTGFVVFRVIGGIGIGAASMLSPLYISEVAPAKIRGKLVSIYQLAIVIGILIIYFVNYGIAGLGDNQWKVDTGWRYMIASGLLPSALFFILLFIVPESPRWLIKNGSKAEAMDTLERLNGHTEAVAVANEIESTLNVEEGSVGELFKPGLRKAMIVGIFLALFSQITGINAIIYYAPIIFKNVGFSSDNALGVTALVGIVNFIFTWVAIGFIDKLGRKTLLLWGVGGMIISLAGVAYCFHAFATGVQIDGIWVVGFIFLYIACFAASLGPIPWVIISEIFPTKTRGVAMSIATTVLWVGTFLISLFTPILLKSASTDEQVKYEAGFHTFTIFLVCAVILWLFTKLKIPETKQKTLEEIELSWKK
jgi:SP family arabinose:H+ symporter-like MFS transporter